MSLVEGVSFLVSEAKAVRLWAKQSVAETPSASGVFRKGSKAANLAIKSGLIRKVVDKNRYCSVVATSTARDFLMRADCKQSAERALTKSVRSYFAYMVSLEQNPVWGLVECVKKWRDGDQLNEFTAIISEGDMKAKEAVCIQLAQLWIDLPQGEVRDKVEVTLINLGANPFETLGSIVEFDSRKHFSCPLAFPGDSVRICQLGWKLQTRNGDHILLKASALPLDHEDE